MGLVYTVSKASSVRVVQEVIVLSPFLIFSYWVLMDEMFSFLSDCMPVSNQRYVEKHVSVENMIAWAAA